MIFSMLRKCAVKCIFVLIFTNITDCRVYLARFNLVHMKKHLKHRSLGTDVSLWWDGLWRPARKVWACLNCKLHTKNRNKIHIFPSTTCFTYIIIYVILYISYILHIYISYIYIYIYTSTDQC